MLSLLAAGSMYVAFPLWVFTYGIADEGRQIGARRLAKYTPNIRCLATLAVLLGLDFALISRIDQPTVRLRLFVADVAVVLVTLMIARLTRASAWGLWWAAIIVGALGALSLPGIGIR